MSFTCFFASIGKTKGCSFSVRSVAKTVEATHGHNSRFTLHQNTFKLNIILMTINQSTLFATQIPFTSVKVEYSIH